MDFYFSMTGLGHPYLATGNTHCITAVDGCMNE